MARTEAESCRRMEADEKKRRPGEMGNAPSVFYTVGDWAGWFANYGAKTCQASAG